MGDVVPVPLEEDSQNHFTAVAAAPFTVSRPNVARPRRVAWSQLITVVVFHLLLPLAFIPWLFSWTGLLLIPLGNYFFCALGIGAGFHRLLTHRSYQCPKCLEHTFALLGVCCLVYSPARWVVVHRMHHEHCDDEEDPHSPIAGFFWAHLGWLLVEDRFLNVLDSYDRYARDILRDPFYLRLERRCFWIWVYVAHALLFYLAGMAIGWYSTDSYLGGVQFGLSLLLYGVVYRTIFNWHVTWSVNSLSHVWGYRNFASNENSRNNWLVALATHGEGWHNNHHADPRSAVHGGYRWWELDVTYLTLRGLAAVGLVWDLVPRRIAMHTENSQQA